LAGNSAGYPRGDKNCVTYRTPKATQNGWFYTVVST